MLLNCPEVFGKACTPVHYDISSTKAWSKPPSYYSTVAAFLLKEGGLKKMLNGLFVLFLPPTSHPSG